MSKLLGLSVGVFLASASTTLIAIPVKASAAPARSAVVVRHSMLVNLAAAQCMLNPELRRLRQCQEGFTLTISGLRPETEQGEVLLDCRAPVGTLPPLQLRVLERIMPDQVVRDSYWRRYGACTGLPERQYYRQITQKASSLKVPAEFSTDRPVLVSLTQMLEKFTSLNPGLPASALQLHCSSAPDLPAPVMTYARVCYTPSGRYASCIGNGVTPVCPARFVIFGRP